MFLICTDTVGMSSDNPFSINQRTKNKLKNKLKKEKLTYNDIESEFDLTRNEVKEYLDNLRLDGFEIPHDIQNHQFAFWIPSAPLRENQENTYKVQKDENGDIKIGIISDTHIGSKFHAEKALNKMYEEFEKNDVYLILHAGDLTEGNGHIYRGQLFEMSDFGYNNLVDKVIKTFPQKEDALTAIISGNHDMSFYNDCGADLVKDVCNQREDLDYMGQYSAKLKINDLEGYIVHPSGGMPYSRSYKIQKMIESMETRPAFLIRGHLHVAMSLPYLGTQGIEAGCFQYQTPYLARKGLHPEVGGWILTIKSDGKGKIKEFNPRWISYSK